MVAEVAVHLGTLLNRNSSDLDLRMVEAAALLHDVGKQRSLQTGEDHAALGARMLAGIVPPAVTKIVGEHVYIDSSGIESPLTESLLVNYSDKRVKHDRIVSVEERFQDLIARYAKSLSHRDLLLEKLKLYTVLERNIFSHLEIEPLGKEIMDITIDDIKGAGSNNHGNEQENHCAAGGREIR